MNAKLKQSLGALGTILGLSVLLGVLAVLQFRWANQIRTVQLERRQATLVAGMNGFREDFRRELAGICMNADFRFQADAGSLENMYARDCGGWANTSDHRDLVSNYYLWETGKDRTYNFRQFDPADASFQTIACPARLGTVCDPSSLGKETRSRWGREFGLASLRWHLHGDTLTLVRAVPGPDFFHSANRKACPPDCFPAGYMIVELNRDVTLGRLTTELTQRYFAGAKGLLYNVAIVGGGTRPRIIYASELPPSPRLTDSPDVSMNLFPLPRWWFAAGEGNRSAEAEGGERAEQQDSHASFQEPPNEISERGWGGPIVADASASQWRLLVRNRGRSLRDAVETDRERDLMLGFGILLLLAASMGLFLIWTQRIQRLARMQMEFVTGVSHELRTPVSVISSAAENLADGVVDSTEQAKRYGALIRDEAQRLAAMIGQVLLFAASRNKPDHYQLRPVPVKETIDSAVEDLEHLTTANGFTVQKEVAPGLPPVMVDAEIFSRCLHNLMTNALKYGMGGGWMAITAQPGVGPEVGEILITVQDRGQGIEPDEMEHIFEPFYRGIHARASQIHGTGLGLSLTKDAAEAMGGRLTVASRLGEGSSFTLHFPAAKQS